MYVLVKRNLSDWAWSPESERKIAHLCSTYEDAKGTEIIFWVHQDIAPRDCLLVNRHAKYR
jgi:hypothetical protein